MDLNEINKRMYKSISDDDIEKYMNTKKHVYRYGELNQLFNGIDDILPKPNDYAILLIESKKNVGHWVALTRTDNIINWFDSYGIKPGNELKWVSEKENQELDNTKSDITDLLDDAINKGYKVKYNTRRYQSSDAEIATCGRHSILWRQPLGRGYPSTAWTTVIRPSIPNRFAPLRTRRYPGAFFRDA